MDFSISLASLATGWICFIEQSFEFCIHESLTSNVSSPDSGLRTERVRGSVSQILPRRENEIVDMAVRPPQDGMTLCSLSNHFDLLDIGSSVYEFHERRLSGFDNLNLSGETAHEKCVELRSDK